MMKMFCIRMYCNSTTQNGLGIYCKNLLNSWPICALLILVSANNTVLYNFTKQRNRNVFSSSLKEETEEWCQRDWGSVFQEFKCLDTKRPFFHCRASKERFHESSGGKIELRKSRWEIAMYNSQAGVFNGCGLKQVSSVDEYKRDVRRFSRMGEGY